MYARCMSVLCCSSSLTREFVAIGLEMSRDVGRTADVFLVGLTGNALGCGESMKREESICGPDLGARTLNWERRCGSITKSLFQDVVSEAKISHTTRDDITLYSSSSLSRRRL